MTNKILRSPKDWKKYNAHAQWYPFTQRYYPGQTENVVDDNRCSRGSMHVSNLHIKSQAPSTIMLEKLYAYARVPLVVPRSHETTFAADHPRSCPMQLFHSERKWLFLLCVVGVELVQWEERNVPRKVAGNTERDVRLDPALDSFICNCLCFPLHFLLITTLGLRYAK